MVVSLLEGGEGFAADGVLTLTWPDLRPGGSAACRSLAEKLREASTCRERAYRILLARNAYEECGLVAVPALDGTYVRIAGYARPLEFRFDDVRTFILGPPPGRCPHGPPPPANQLILVKAESGVDLSFDPLFVAGRLSTVESRYDSVTVAYRLEADAIRRAAIPDVVDVSD